MSQPPLPGLGNNLSVTVASGDGLDVREFSVHERMSELFSVTLTVVAENADIDFEAVVGKEARFEMQDKGGARSWSGVCNEMHQLAVEEGALSTYHLQIVPTLWLATQRRNHRMFQQLTELDIVLEVLADWGITPTKKISGKYKKRKYKVQYAESDYTFLCRMLEDAGISFYFEEADGETKLVLNDAPQSNEPRKGKIPFRDQPGSTDKEHVTGVRIGRRVRPGKYTLRDHDYRQPPSYKLLATAGAQGGNIEDKLERFHYTPGAFLFESDKGGETPHADDKGKHRTDEAEGVTLAQKRLDAKRGTATVSRFQTNVIDLAPGVVMSMLDHPRSDLGQDKPLLVLESQLDGVRDKEWSHHIEAVSAEKAYRPALQTPKPKVIGVESATVVGSPGEEIHTDEFGRVRVHFHWDRESQMDDNSSCWIHVNQPWGGTGYGGTNLPRVGQEVLVDFFGGDPDRPVIVGRVFTNLQKTPYKLPANKTQSGWKSNSTNQTGGYNELMFEDQAGSELVRMQAEKDMHKLVKHDEESTVGRNRTRVVKNDEQVTIGNDRTKQVKGNETTSIGKNFSQQIGESAREMIGMNQSSTVGVNRSTQVGVIDSTVVGDTHSIAVMPPGEGAAASTSIVTKHDKIVLRTHGGASITLDGKNITVQAGKGGDVILKGGPMVKVNP